MNQKRGFTLIELLVVIAIIALLLSIIMPALNKAKTYAEEVLCKSNIRQYGIATEMYCNENDETVPHPWTSLYSSVLFAGEQERFCRWHNPDYNLESHPEYAGPYWPYLEVTKANVCPTFSKLATKYGRFHMEGNGGATAGDCIGGPFEPQFSYSMNGIFDGGTIKKSQVKSPSQTFLWAEENMWTLTSLTTHVLNDNALLVGPDKFASFHKISKGKLSIQQETHRYESDSGVSNVLLVDGSIAWLTPEQCIDYRGEIR